MVVRDGRVQHVKVESLVVGDVVQILEGERVPADCRALASTNLHVDMSSLNGESMPFGVTGETSDEGTEPLESRALAFNGSPVTEGRGYGLVIRTGDASFIGQVAALANSKVTGETTFEREVTHFVRIISILAISMAVLFLVIGIARGRDPVDTLLNAFIVIVVANIPQGLPASVTSLLTVAAQ